MTNIMLILSEAISKGARPFFTEEGQRMIADYLNSKEKEAKKVGA
jgi:hypothetical protein